MHIKIKSIHNYTIFVFVVVSSNSHINVRAMLQAVTRSFIGKIFACLTLHGKKLCKSCNFAISKDLRISIQSVQVK